MLPLRGIACGMEKQEEGGTFSLQRGKQKKLSFAQMINKQKVDLIKLVERRGHISLWCYDLSYDII